MTDRTRLADRDLLSVVENAVRAGVDWVQIREKDLSARLLEDLVHGAVSLAGSAKVLVNDRVDVALACGAGGVHLPADGLPVDRVKRMCPPDFLVGVSTHSKPEAQAAAEKGADFVVFGPVFATTSKPGACPVGVEALAGVVKAIPIPVLALGGVTPERVEEVAATGAAGVAGITVFHNDESLRALMRAVQLANTSP